MSLSAVAITLIVSACALYNATGCTALLPVSYDALLGVQNSVCAVCKRPFASRGNSKFSPVVDHDHNTGVARGVLHNVCNRAIGLLEDSATFADSASRYLKVPPYATIRSNATSTETT